MSIRPNRSSSRQRWLARLAMVFFAATGLVVIGSSGFTGVFLVITGLITAAALLAGAFWFLARRGVTRWVGLGIVVLAVVVLIYSYAAADVILVALLAAGLLAVEVAAARAALDDDTEPWMPATEVTPAHRPFIVMNPHSGGGKVVRFGLQEKAEELGAQVTLHSVSRAVGLLRRDTDSVKVLTGPKAVIEADGAEIPVGVDGEALMVPTPVVCTIRPKALRVRLPRDRPGVPRPRSRIAWDRLWRLAFGRTVDPVRAG